VKILLRHGRVFYHGRFRFLDLAIAGGVVSDVAPDISPEGFDSVFDLPDSFIVPGLTDVHVHLREPGFSYKETIASGTAAAARGGCTRGCAMPNVEPPPDSAAHLDCQLELIKKTALIPVLPYGCITVGQKGGGELADYRALAKKVAGFSDDGRGIQQEDDMRRAMQAIKAAGSLVAAHCEDEALLHGGYIHDGEYARAHGHRGISSESEWGQIARDVRLVRETGCRYHVCHVSTKESVEILRSAKREGLPVTCETAPHYLVLCDGDIEEDGRFKMNPPLRAKEDRDALREGLRDGTIDLIATDHAPHAAEEKNKGLKGSALGVVGLETAFPVLYTELVRSGLLAAEKLVDLMTAAPRRAFGLPGNDIEIKKSADIAVFDVGKRYTIDTADFLSKGRSTPFSGRKVFGESRLTMAQGKIVWQKT
jgi:dihydroorotase